MSELVKIRMHGIFAEKIGKEFNLAVNSVSEAFHAINVVTNDSIRRLQLENIQNDLKYSNLINEKPVNLSSLDHINQKNINDLSISLDGFSGREIEKFIIYCHDTAYTT